MKLSIIDRLTIIVTGVLLGALLLSCFPPEKGECGLGFFKYLTAGR